MMPGVVLIVEDEAHVRESFRMLLDREGYRSLVAEDVGGALAVLQREPVDAVVCDILLKERSGLALLIEINARQLNVPVILITGEPNYESAAMAVRQGAFDYLAKPVRKEALLLVLEKALGHKALLERKVRLEEENRLYRHNLEELVRTRTLALKQANADLRQEVEERRKAETALALLNKDLETLVESRTRELAVKNLELEASNRRLTELDAMKSAFLSLVSHELRTPMTSVLGFAKLIRKDFVRHFLPLSAGLPELAAKGQRIQENLEVIEQEGHRLTRIISDVLDITRIEAGRMDWRQEVLDPAEIVRQAAQAMHGLFQEKPAVRLRVDTPQTPLPHLVADPDRLQQVLINLLSNAHKFTDAGEVHLLVEAINNQTPPVIRFTVRDTGQGVHPDDAAHIFEKFYQGRLGMRDQDKPQGAGLGLVICRTIVDHYGGKLWMDSTKGQGSTFYVELPAAT
ncbi:MAG: response regulator [Desulfovibrio sp.]|nr:response regulator [Desulfovibrio sp.]